MEVKYRTPKNYLAWVQPIPILEKLRKLIYGRRHDVKMQTEKQLAQHAATHIESLIAATQPKP